MIFEHCNYLGDLELNKKETKGIRLYNLPNGDWVPSITVSYTHLTLPTMLWV